MTPSSIHARRGRRHHTELPVQVSVRKRGGQTIAPGRGTNLSRGGMALHAKVSLDPEDHIELEFKTPSKPHVAGIIRNRVGHRFGVEFLGPLQSSRCYPSAAPPHEGS
jgi:PilZ domain